MRINSIDNKMSFGQKFVSRNVKKFSNSNSLKGLSNSPVKGLSENAKSSDIVTSAILNTAISIYAGFTVKSINYNDKSFDYYTDAIELVEAMVEAESALEN